MRKRKTAIEGKKRNGWSYHIVYSKVVVAGGIDTKQGTKDWERWWGGVRKPAK